MSTEKSKIGMHYHNNAFDIEGIYIVSFTSYDGLFDIETGWAMLTVV